MVALKIIYAFFLCLRYAKSWRSWHIWSMQNEELSLIQPLNALNKNTAIHKKAEAKGNNSL